MVDDGADPKLVHGKAAMAKLFASEAADRCADRCVQVFGGRGYMRTTRPSGSCASCASTASGRARARSSG